MKTSEQVQSRINTLIHEMELLKVEMEKTTSRDEYLRYKQKRAAKFEKLTALKWVME